MRTLTKSTGNIGLDILLQDLDLALAWLKMTDSTGVPDAARRNREKALKAYRDVVAALQAVTLSEEVQAQFDAKLGLLSSRLRETAESVTAA